MATFSRRRNRPQPEPRGCKKHPNIPAVREGLCASCLEYKALGKEFAKKTAVKEAAR